MQKRSLLFFVLTAVLFVAVCFVPSSVEAAQAETYVACDEGVITEPIAMIYGDYTSNCGIGTTTDIDQFTFNGIAGDNIRISVDSRTAYFDPRLEVRDPDGTVIENSSCTGTSGTCSFSVNLSLALSGTYYLAVSDNGVDETGNYVMQIERIPPNYTAPAIDYNSTVADTISPTTDMDFLVFHGKAGSDIRISVDSKTAYSDPRLEVRDPDGTVIVDTYCTGTSSTCSFSTDLSLTLTGTYYMAVSERGVDETGNYDVTLNCLFGTCENHPSAPTIDLSLNKSSFITGDTLTVSAHMLNGTEPANVEVKTWIYLPDGREMTILDSHITLAVDPDADFVTNIFQYTFKGVAEPSGVYEVGSRFIDIKSGRQISMDIEYFTFSP